MLIKAVSAGRRRYPVITNGLKLYLDAYNLDSYPGTGTTWYDLSNSGYNFVNNGATWTVSGDRRYFEFDGVNDYFEGVSTTSIFNSNTSGRTWSLWVNYVTAPAFLDVLVCAQFDSKMPYYFDNRDSAGTTGNGYQFGAAGAIDVSTQYNTTITTGVWIHAAATWTYATSTTGTFKIYLNGTEVSSTFRTNQSSRTYAAQDNNTPPNIGCLKLFANYVRFNNFQVGELLNYNRPLTATEISNNYNSTKSNYGL